MIIPKADWGAVENRGRFLWQNPDTTSASLPFAFGQSCPVHARAWLERLADEVPAVGTGRFVDLARVHAQVVEDALPAVLPDLQHRVKRLRPAEADREVAHDRPECALRAERRVAQALVRRIPEAEALVVDARGAWRLQEADAEVVAVTEVEEVVRGPHVEAAARPVVRIVAGVERMDVAEAVAARTEQHARVDVRDAQVRKGVVIALHEDADGVRGPVADDVHVEDVAVGRAVVRAALDVDAHAHVLDRDIADARLASAVDRDAVRDAASVQHAAREAVVAANRADVVRRMARAEPHQGLGGGPPRRGLEDGVVGEAQVHAPARMRGREDGLREEVRAVREVERAVGVRVDETLQGVRHVRPAIGHKMVRDDHKALPRRLRRRQTAQRHQRADHHAAHLADHFRPVLSFLKTRRTPPRTV